MGMILFDKHKNNDISQELMISREGKLIGSTSDNNLDISRP